MVKQRGASVVEFILVALIMCFLFAIIVKNYQDAVLAERRTIAQQALMTSAGLQERWFVRMYEYAKRIEEVGGADAAGDHYVLRVTQDPCGNASCYTITATTAGEQVDDAECERMSINNLGVKRSVNRRNQDTSSFCWKTD